MRLAIPRSSKVLSSSGKGMRSQMLRVLHDPLVPVDHFESAMPLSGRSGLGELPPINSANSRVAEIGEDIMQPLVGSGYGVS
jgi:hypothetical protein